jgi:hypothetical protein
MVKLSLKTILVAGIGLVTSSLISGYFFSIGATLWELTTQGKLDFGSPFWLVSVPLGIIGILLLIYGIYLGKHKPTPQGENIIMPAPSQKMVGWFSKLRRNPIRKEKRLEFWTTMIILIIVGAITIIIDFSFRPTSLPQEGIFIFLLTRYTLLFFGIMTIALPVWFMIIELYVEREFRKQHITDRKTSHLDTIKSFDNSFQSLRKATQPETREIRLDDFENWLRVICIDFFWDEVGNGITEVLKYMPDKLFDDSLVDHYVSWLKMMINGQSKHTIPMIKEKFLTELEKMYDNPKLGETDRDVIYILMELHENDGEYLIGLVNDAANRWNDLRFIELTSTIEKGFSELSKRSQEEYRKFYYRLDEKMEVAERNKDEQAFSRLKTLRNIAKRHLLTTRKGMRQRVEET